VLTEWTSFRALNWRRLIPTMRRPLVIDLRNIYDPAEMARLGVSYVPLGRAEGDMNYRATAEGRGARITSRGA
jgi:UDPglucose 6-dehydrogenase